MTDTSPDSAGGGFRALVYFAQFFFGGWFVLHGLNHWMNFFPQPPGSSPLAAEVIGALIKSGMFDLVKALEVVTGVMMLLNRMVPLAIVLAAPIGIAIAFLDHTANPDWYGTVTALTIMVFLAIMAVGHLDRFLPMLAFNQGDPSCKGLNSLLGKSNAEG